MPPLAASQAIFQIVKRFLLGVHQHQLEIIAPIHHDWQITQGGLKVRMLTLLSWIYYQDLVHAMVQVGKAHGGMTTYDDEKDFHEITFFNWK